jgi:hypothetical protein
VSAIAQLLLAAFLVSGLACLDEVSTTRESSAVSVDRRIELLGKIVTLPATPVEVWFEQVPIGTLGGFGPTDYTLIAVLRFARDDTATIMRAAEPRPGAPPRLSTRVQRFPSRCSQPSSPMTSAA